MIRVVHIATDADSRLKTQDIRRPSFRRRSGQTYVFCCLFLAFCLLSSVCLSGCNQPKDNPPIWEEVKISDLVPTENGKPKFPQKVKTINLDVHIFEVPAENIDKLDKIRKKLYVRPLRLRDYGAFYANSFWIRFGYQRMWNEVYEMLLNADGQRLTRISLMLPDAWPETVTITGSDRPQSIVYTAINGSKEVANVGPGILGLRIRAKAIPTSPGECSVTAYPVFTPPVKSTIPELNAQVKRREFPFTFAAFGLNMRPGQFVVLAPTKYVEDQTTLGGLFFSNPQGTLFLGKDNTNSPERKPAVRVFLLICTRID